MKNSDLETTARLAASIVYEDTKRSGLGHQYRAEEKSLTACESFLRQASAVLDGTIQTELKIRIELLITDVITEAAGAKDKFNDNQ